MAEIKVNVTPFASENADSHHNEDANNNNNNNGKMALEEKSGKLTAAWTDKELEVNPWNHRLNAGFLGWIQILVMSCCLAPLRLIVILLLLCYMNLLSRLGLLGVSRERLEEKPLTGWRWLLQSLIWMLGRGLFFCMGIHWITVKGKQDPPSSAPVLVVAPHATIADALSIILSGATPVAKQEISQTPLIGTIGRFLQVLFVKREKESSRKKALDQIRKHATSVRTAKWKRPLLLFPEGTCTNGKALIHFKAGAFNSGLPVQPVTLRFKSKPDTVTWTWDQKYGAFGCLWLTLCQFNTRVEIEYLPVCEPNEAERKDPRVFAARVRDVMGQALGIPIVDQKLEHAKALMQQQGPTDPDPNPEWRRWKKSSFIEALQEDLELDLDEHFDPGKKGYNYVDYAGNLNLM